MLIFFEFYLFLSRLIAKHGWIDFVNPLNVHPAPAASLQSQSVSHNRHSPANVSAHRGRFWRWRVARGCRSCGSFSFFILHTLSVCGVWRSPASLWRIFMTIIARIASCMRLQSLLSLIGGCKSLSAEPHQHPITERFALYLVKCWPSTSAHVWT